MGTDPVLVMVYLSVFSARPEGGTRNGEQTLFGSGPGAQLRYKGT